MQEGNQERLIAMPQLQRTYKYSSRSRASSMPADGGWGVLGVHPAAHTRERLELLFYIHVMFELPNVPV